MKLFNSLFNLSIILSLLAIISTACDPEPEPPAPVAATVSLASDPGFISTDSDVPAGQFFMVKFRADTGSSPLNSLTVSENGARIEDLDRLTYNGDPASASPALLLGADKSGLVWEIGIRAHDVVDESRTYTIEVSDEEGLRQSVSLNITAIANVTEGTMYLLLNAGGPMGTGGLDLLTGTGTGSADAAAHIKDLGIDINLPVDQNWLKKISGVNGSVLKIPSGVSYAEIQTQQQIIDAFNDAAATEITESDPVVKDNEFLVKNGDNYFFLLVTDVVPTAADNADYYEFSVKR